MTASRTATSSRLTHTGRPQLVRESEPAVNWADYPRIAPGVYPAYCKKAHWYWEPGFKRWTCLLLFDVLCEGLQSSVGTIPMWMNGGNGDKPKAGRRTLYFPAWVKANGGPPPRKDRLSPHVFEKRMAIVRVADTLKGALPYSVVRQILEWSTGTPVNQSHSQGRSQSKQTQSGVWRNSLSPSDEKRPRVVSEESAQAGVEV
jgi:hypothetical protein